MQKQLSNHDQTSIDGVLQTNKLVSQSSVISQDSSLTRPLPNRRHTLRHTLFNSSTAIIQQDALSTIPLEQCEDIIQIRTIRRYSKPAYNDIEQPSIITINISGDRFQTYLSTLQSYPNTLLGDENKRKFYWNPQNGEYFFDRHRACFEAILYYYQSRGRLRRPNFVPLDTFLEEIAFFELGKEALDEVRVVEDVKPVTHHLLPEKIWRRYIWFYFEYPQHSNIARALNLISMFLTVLSCIALATESLPQFTNHWDDICRIEANVSLNSTYIPRCSALFTSPFFIIETICVIYFTIEFVLRLISTPSYRRFVLSFYNWVDLSSIVPYYVFLGIQLADQDLSLNTNAVLCIRLLRILRFVRIFKIHLVFQRLKSLRVLSATMRESFADFLVLFSILTLLAFLFGAAVYFAEHGANGDVFDSIPKSIYWGIITITSVGYGDMCPITPTGRVITCICALFGSATMGMLTSVLVDRYQRVYNRKMYISDSEIPPADVNIKNNIDDETGSIRRDSIGKPKLSATSSHQILTVQEKTKVIVSTDLDGEKQ